MLTENDRRLADLLDDSFTDIADRISDVLDEEFDKRKTDDLHPGFFNAGYKYTDFLGRILSNEFGELSAEDVKLADKIIDREIKKLSKAEIFTLRTYAIEYGSNWHGSVKAARMHILEHWKRKLLADFMYDDTPEFFEFPVTPVNWKPSECPYCGGKVVDISYDEPTDEILEKVDRGDIVLGTCMVPEHQPDWQCINCGCEFKKIK